MAKLVLPNGHGHGWKPDTPDPINDYTASDLLKVIHKKSIAKIQSERPQIWLNPSALSKTKDQGPQGSCEGHGITQLLEWSYRSKRKHDVQLSPAFAYMQARILEGSLKEDAGAENRDTVKAASKLGVCLEKFSKYDPHKLTTTASKGAMRNAQAHQISLGYYRTDDYEGGDPAKMVDNIIRALDADLGIMSGYAWYSCLDTAEFENTGVMPVPKPGDRIEGGHCNWICGVDIPARLLLLQNSYGEDFGAKHPVTGAGGFVWMPFEYVIKKISDDNWAVRHE